MDKLYFILTIVFATCTASHAETVTKSVPLTVNVTRIYLNGASELNLTQGEDEYVKLTTEADRIPGIEARVKGKSLYLGREVEWQNDTRQHNAMPPRFDVQLKQIDAVRVIGSGHVNIGDLVTGRLRIILAGSGDAKAGMLRSPDFTLEMAGSCEFESASVESPEIGIKLSGSGKAKIAQLRTDRIKINVTGSGGISLTGVNAGEMVSEVTGSADIDLKGKTGRQELVVTGSGDYKAEGLSSDVAYVEIRGSGNARLNVQQQLTAELTRGADLVYQGGPDLAVDISGKGKSRRSDSITGK